MSAIDLKRHWEAAVKPPEGWQGDLYFHNRLGQKIRYGYAPALGERKGTVVLTHGYAEHIDLYHETIKRYQRMGYDVWGMDWQGHGKSERDNPAQPLLPSAKGMMRQVRDLDFFITNVVKTHHDPNSPLIMSTHSMGGHIGLLYLKKYPGVFDGAVMSAPMFDIYRLGMGSWARPVIRGIFNAAASLGLRDVPVPTLDELFGIVPTIGQALLNVFRRPTTLRGEFRDMVKNLVPDARLGRPTFGWIAAAYNTITPSMQEEFLRSIKTPTLIGSAEKEDLVANDAHRRAAELMPNAKNVLISGAGHGLWFANDEPFESWWGHIASFLEEIKPAQVTKEYEDMTVAGIAAGENYEKTLRGRTVAAPRCPVCLEDILVPRHPEGMRPAA